ncbi:MAG TPA: Tim44/TimA family putative adaptor protein [Alphaproteobacteria bacterium]
MTADLMIYAIVAAGLVFWLRSVLGTRRSDDPPPRVNPFTVRPETAAAVDSRPAALPAPAAAAAPGDLSAGLERNMAIEGTQAQQGLMDIARADALFSLLHFLRGAQDAFAMVVEAFAAGDRESLQGLLSPPVYTAFCGVLDSRAQSGETASVEIHAVRRAEVVDAKLEKRLASITVKFTADETSLLRDRDGKLLAGHPDRVTEAVDIWTFARDIRSREPAWLITETREGAGDQQPGSTVPDAHK